MQRTWEECIMKISARERILNAWKAAAKRLKERADSIPAISDPTSPGDLYVFDIKNDELAVEWVVVRDHPQNPNWVLVVPIDTFFLVGTPDLVLPDEIWVARCGQSDWFEKSMFDPTLRVGAISNDVLKLIKQRLADLARGRDINPVESSVDYDPEYEDHINEIEKARQALLKEVV